MSSDLASLDNLRDIVVPTPVPWWPPAVGWWIVFALLLVASVVIGVRAWRTWRANAYRRAAFRELQLASGAEDVAGILKRAVLCIYPRSEVASLSGRAWCRWLEQVGGRAVPETARDGLTRGVFQGASGVQFRELRAFAEDWIRNHHRAQVVDGGRPRPSESSELWGRHSGREEGAEC